MKYDDSKGTVLAKVLTHYKLLPDTYALKQKICCPFHANDINPSLLVNLEDGSWFCFGCQKTGDAQRFVQLMEKKYNNLGDLKSLQRYYEILKSNKYSNIKVDVAQVKQSQKPQKQLYNEAYDYYHGLRTVEWNGDEDSEVIAAKQYMQQRGFNPDALNAVRAKVTYNDAYGLIFPMMDNKKFRGWVCRTMRKDIEARRKYLYNEGFSRATTLVGNYGKDSYAIVVEGYMDRLKFVEYGLDDNVVAILGWKMSKQQEDKLRQSGVRYIVSALDNDDAGQKGTRYLKTIFGTTNVIRWQYLKGVKDPGDMSRVQFDKMYRKTMSLLEKQTKFKKENQDNGRFSRSNQK